jgi:sugar/nucleoside kinase (ribokinase family)
VVVGNVVEDRAAGGWTPGGPSLYSARTAAALGVGVTLVTCLPPDFTRDALCGLDITAVRSALAPRYANAYAPDGSRSQQLLAPGEDIAALPDLSGADAVILAPAYHELDALLERPASLAQPAGCLFAIALQGLLRSVDGAGNVRPRNDPLTAARSVPPGAFAFFSDEDTPAPDALAAALARQGATAVLTRGYRGATIYRPGRVDAYQPVPASAADPTGAGDVFATAFVVRMIETRDMDQAARFALAAGALAVEAPGLEAIPTREQIEARLARAAA